jgi:pimeloyl-ACP methyl ester carboxylesterase
MKTEDIREQWVELSHGRTRYFEAGSGDPMLLLHGAGFASGGDNWLLNIGPLAEHFRVLAPDCVGWGAGDQLTLGYSFAYLVDFVREFQDALNIARSHVVGHSMGGWIASLLAYESPNRIEKLVLVASGGLATRPLPTMVDWQPPTEAQFRASLANLERAGVDVEPLVQKRLAWASEPDRVARFRDVMLHMTNSETRYRYNTARRLPLVQSSTLVLWGSEDKVNSIDLGETTHRLISGSRLVIFEGAGHGLPSEQPGRFNGTVLDFLQS